MISEELIGALTAELAAMMGSVGQFNPGGTANSIRSLRATLVGLRLIIAGFWRFLMGCVIFLDEPWSWGTGIFRTIFGTPVTLSATTFNVLTGFAGARSRLGSFPTTRSG